MPEENTAAPSVQAVPDHTTAYRRMVAFAENLAVTAVKGISVEAPCEIMDGTFLVPFSEVPDSLSKRDAAAYHLPGIPTVAAMPVYPPAAMVCNANTPVEWRPRKLLPDQPVWFKYLDRHRHAASIIGLCQLAVVLPYRAWYQPTDPETAQSVRTLPYRYEYEAITDRLADTRFDAACIASISDYFLCDENLRSHIDLSIDRLNKSLRRQQVGDQTLELAIAIESLVADPKNTAELNFRMALRMALLQDGPIAQKQAARDLLKAFYGVRGAFVHTGVIPTEKRSVPGQGKMDPAEIVARARVVCACTVRRLLRQRMLPDWPRLELGEGFSDQ